MVSSTRCVVVLLGTTGFQRTGAFVVPRPAARAPEWQRGLPSSPESSHSCPTACSTRQNSSSMKPIRSRDRPSRVACRMTDGSTLDQIATLQHLAHSEDSPEDSTATSTSTSTASAFETAVDDHTSESSSGPTAAAASASAKAPSKKRGGTDKAADNEDNSSMSTTVTAEDDNAPIDWILSRRLPINSRRFYRKALEAGNVDVDGRTVRRFVRVVSGAKITVKGAATSSTAAGGMADSTPRNFLAPEKLPGLHVLFEDEHFMAVMKPAAMICQPCEAAPRGTVLHGLLHHMIKTKQVAEGDLAASRTLGQGIVQRLDKQTSGIMIVAKTLDASSKFSSMFKKANVKKEYLAICHGDPGFDSVIDVPLYRRSSGKVGAVSKSQAAQYRARDAQTRVRNVASSSGVSLCKAQILTGRMHQIRVHLKWKGCPIVGDKEYGDPEANYRVSHRSAARIDAHRPLLHSMSLEFVHPFTKKFMTFRAPLPDDMWGTADKILRAAGTPDQRHEFKELQDIRSAFPDERPHKVGGRGAPRFARSSKRGRGGRGGMGAREAYDAVVETEMFEQI